MRTLHGPSPGPPRGSRSTRASCSCGRARLPSHYQRRLHTTAASFYRTPAPTLQAIAEPTLDQAYGPKQSRPRIFRACRPLRFSACPSVSTPPWPALYGPRQDVREQRSRHQHINTTRRRATRQDTGGGLPAAASCLNRPAPPQAAAHAAAHLQPLPS
ncbi:uncharacterized protein PFL1_04607 [Pseudozyma flocculosa PF-1]|uniref:Uncharacterized protein n=1 Tax=Pseudozyma flocculosa PF-1 TaxID=1277687 RepID=A0A061H5F2_9BASI|nr:uncharacterized protein PFL1_04607 [Pseudozyma flocculosa PF-1]EPQ27863.1 hypothetical protein PFL1_04607 [Pseudozyma flocculosa PF-1]